jgi:hypothetical protein
MTPQPDTRPLTSDEHGRLLESASRLSDLLVGAAPLINLLNAAETPPSYRATFAQRVGMYRFATALYGLKAMSDRSVWEHAHRRPTQSDDS